MKKYGIALSFLLILLLSENLQSQDNILEQLKKVAIIDQKVMMPMRDSIKLCTDIFRPKTDKPVPVIFVKTPYNFNSWGNGKMRRVRTQEDILNREPL